MAGRSLTSGISGKSSSCVAVGSTNFHGVELKIIGEPIIIDHTDYRTYEYRVRMENVSVPNTGPLNDKNSAVVAAWNSAKAIKDEKLPPRLKIEWIEFESPYFETWPPATHTNILFARGDMPEAAYAREVVRRGTFAAATSNRTAIMAAPPALSERRLQQKDLTGEKPMARRGVDGCVQATGTGRYG